VNSDNILAFVFCMLAFAAFLLALFVYRDTWHVGIVAGVYLGFMGLRLHRAARDYAKGEAHDA